MTDSLKRDLERIATALRQREYDVRETVVEPVASTEEVQGLERQLGFPLPSTLRRLLTTISRHVEFRWFVPKGLRFPPPFKSNFSGDLHWSTQFTATFNAAKDGWLREAFPDPADPYDAVWHQKLAFYEVGNGDYFAIDLASGSGEAVVYLSHDDGEGHGHVIAENVLKLIELWIPLGCCGGEDWQWLPFTNGKTTPIDPECENARTWRRLLGLAT